MCARRSSPARRCTSASASSGDSLPHLALESAQKRATGIGGQLARVVAATAQSPAPMRPKASLAGRHRCDNRQHAQTIAAYRVVHLSANLCRCGQVLRVLMGTKKTLNEAGFGRYHASRRAPFSEPVADHLDAVVQDRHVAAGNCPVSLQAIAGAVRRVSSPGPLVGRRCPIAAKHLPAAPAGQAHQVALLHATGEHGVGEGVPE